MSYFLTEVNLLDICTLFQATKNCVFGGVKTLLNILKYDQKKFRTNHDEAR